MSDKKGKVLAKGSKEWWHALALNESAKRYRLANGLPEDSSVILSIADINKVIDEWDKSVWKRIWILITTGNIRELNLGEVVTLKTKAGE